MTRVGGVISELLAGLLGVGVVAFAAQLPPGVGTGNVEYTLGAFGATIVVVWLLWHRTDRKVEVNRASHEAAHEALKADLARRFDTLQETLAAQGREFGGNEARLAGIVASLTRLRDDVNSQGSRLTNQLYARYDPQVEALDSRLNRMELRVDNVLAVVRKSGDHHA